jgi:hypothetical protein
MDVSKLRAIDRASVQKICSGQVIVELATAVKELLENSLVRRCAWKPPLLHVSPATTVAAQWAIIVAVVRLECCVSL